ncbi:MAG: DUF4091 domain-containing protein [Acidobacteriota bacterium]|jgi:hypothetical protein|nr:DUF4091 domain-containing protein [Acidobacteriota bacterium]
MSLTRKPVLQHLAAAALAAAALALFSCDLFTEPPAKAAPAGDLRVEVTRDAGVSSYPGETEDNNGGAAQIKLKGFQEMVLLDIDAAPLAGRVIERATLHLRVVSPDTPLKRVGVSSLAAPFTEGTGRYAKIAGASTFRWRAYPDAPWLDGDAWGYSDLTQVMFGEGGTFWSHADATPPDAEGWQSVEVDPKILAARAAGLSEGFVLFDDTGTELVRSGAGGEHVTIDTFPNRLFYSREQNASSAPYFTVRLAGLDADARPPAPPEDLRAEVAGHPAGEATVRWEAPSWRDGRIIGFRVKVDGAPAPRHMIPAPGFGDASARQTVSMRLRGLGLKPGQATRLEVAAVDEAGRTGEAAALTFAVSAEAFAAPAGFGQAEAPQADEAAAPQILRLPGSGTATLSILDELDKVSAKGELIPRRPASYFASNHVWSASQDRIRLAAARGEFTGFQIHLAGDVPALQMRLDWAEPAAPGDGGAPRAEFARFGYIPSPAGNVPDPVIPLAPGARMNVKGSASLLCEVFVPKSAKAGVRRGTLTLSSGGADVYAAEVELTVWDFELPDALSFLPEMNCYGLPENERDYYRMAHLHRTYLNRVPYSHRGYVSDGCAPKWDAASRTFDWSAWDRRYQGYFDGTAFAGLPRGETPTEGFYLPLFENFPADIFTQHDGGPWADEAFTAQYKETFQAAAREFARHFIERGWRRTGFQFYLNNKMNYKEDGWSKASSPWLLDEPASFQDFDALRFFGELLWKGMKSLPSVAASSAGAPIRFRADISRPQWQRDALDRVLGLNVVSGGEFHRYNRMIRDRKERYGQTLYTYGGTCAPEEGAYQPVIWSLDAWSLGADGILPWQTVGTADSWKASDALALFYPKPEGAGQNFPRVSPSLRLKGYRRGQQDVEYLVLLQKKLGLPRRDVERLVRQELNLRSENLAASDEDAGTLRFDAVSAQDLWLFRRRVARLLQGGRPLEGAAANGAAR